MCEFSAICATCGPAFTTPSTSAAVLSPSWEVMLVGSAAVRAPPPSLFLPLVSDGAKLFSSNEFPRLYCWSKCVGLRPLRGREKVGGDAPQDMMHSIGLYTAAHSKCVPLATARSFFSFLYLSLFFLFLYFQICMDPTYVYNVMQASDGCLWTSRNSLTDFPIV